MRHLKGKNFAIQKLRFSEIFISELFLHYIFEYHPNRIIIKRKFNILKSVGALENFSSRVKENASLTRIVVKATINS